MYENIIPAHCPNCGAIFKSRLVSVSGNVTGLKLSGNKESCPYCGSMANTADGVFDITNNILSVVSSPEITKQMLSEFNTILKNAYQNNTDISTLVNEAMEISPQLGKLVETESKKGIALYALLVMLIFILSSCSLDVEVKLDVNELIEQLSDTPPAKIVSESSYKPKLPKAKIKSKTKVLTKVVNTSKKKIGRNVLCPCGSGIKFKKCCGKNNSSS